MPKKLGIHFSSYFGIDTRSQIYCLKYNRKFYTPRYILINKKNWMLTNSMTPVQCLFSTTIYSTLVLAVFLSLLTHSLSLSLCTCALMCCLLGTSRKIRLDKVVYWGVVVLARAWLWHVQSTLRLIELSQNWTNSCDPKLSLASRWSTEHIKLNKPQANTYSLLSSSYLACRSLIDS